MLRRCVGLAILGVFTFALTLVQAQSPSYDKEAVRRLSKRIDEHLGKTWNKLKVTPAPKAEDHIFFRRLNLDLAGRIPDLSDITNFMDNEEADKRWMWVDKMLDNNPTHGRHFANVWRNIIIGTQSNQQNQFFMPQFETWLRNRIDKNVAMDQMVLQLLTSQQGNQPGGLGRMDFNGPESPQLFFQANENKAENLAGATSRVFLGVKIECAQCHKHPFAKWNQEQFWEFAAFYSAPNVQPRPKGLQPAPMPKFTPGREILIPGTEKVVKAKFLNGKEPNWHDSNNARRTLAEWIVTKDNPYFARAMADHLWSYLMGVSLLEPILEPSDDSPVTHPELLNDLAKGLIDNNFDAKFLIRAIVHSDAYQRASGGAKLADKEDYQLFVRMPMRALSPEQIYDSLMMATNGAGKDQPQMNDPRVFNPGQLQSDRAKFLAKYQTQDRRHEPQTSILQALFLMNGEFLAKRTNVANNGDLKAIANPKAYEESGHAGRLRSLYRLVLSRPPRTDEINRLVPYLEKGGATGDLEHAVSDVYWALLNSSEFLLNH